MTTHTDGERIAAVRTSLGLSRADLAGLLDVSFETVKGWEIGRRAMPSGAWHDVIRLRARFDTEVAWHIAGMSTLAPGEAVLRLDEGPESMPLGWQRAVAAAVLRQIPELTIIRDRG